MGFLKLLQYLILRACFVKPKNTVLPVVFAILSFPIGFFGGITIGGTLGISWGSILGRLGSLIGLVLGYCIVLLLTMGVAINVGNVMGHLFPMRREVVVPRLNVAMVVAGILSLLMMHAFLAMLFVVHSFAFKSQVSQEFAERRTLQRLYKEARGDHAKMFYLRAKDALEKRVDLSQQKKASNVAAKLARFVDASQRDQKWYAKYVRFRIAFDKATEDKHISAKELSKLEDILERD